MIEFIAGWDTDNNPKLSEADAKQFVLAAVNKYLGTNQEFLDLKAMVTSASPLGKAKVAKGLHQDQGNDAIVERHMTVELPWFPYPKRYHIFFWQQKKTWTPVSISHETAKNIFSKVSL